MSYDKRAATTVYPTRAGAFPPVTFFALRHAIDYGRDSSHHYHAGHGTCPALSYAKHYPDTERLQVRATNTPRPDRRLSDLDMK